MSKIIRIIKSLSGANICPKIIKEKPKPINIENLKHTLFVEINNKICRKQTSPPKEFSWEFVFLFGVLLSIPLYMLYLYSENLILQIIGTIIYVFISLLAGNFTIYIPYEEIILNREEGTITFHRKTRKRDITIPFNLGEAFIMPIESGNYMSFSLRFGYKNNLWKGDELATIDMEEFWNFVVWYMDKNRPLPPGTAFDPYREADFQRRKAEGFPKPLYKSYIPTPEATRRQQLERERIGKW